MARRSFSDALAISFVTHDVQLSRLQADHRRTLLKSLRTLEQKLVTAIATQTDGATFTAARSRALLKVVRVLVTQQYDRLQQIHGRVLLDLADYESRAIPNLLNADIRVPLFSVGLPQTALTSLVSNDTVVGVPLKSFWNQQRVGFINRFTTAMRAGLFAGETTHQLIQRVRGTKARNFQDGLMQTSRVGAEVLVRTAAQSVVNDIRMKLYQEHGHLLKGVQAHVTLDQRTSEICIARSGESWDLEGQPLGKTNEPFPGPPPWHPNCRSTLLPILKTFGELAGDPELDREAKKRLKGIPNSTQESMNGQVAGDLTYEQWLKTQPESVQLDVLGPGRLKLWKAKKISLRDLIDQRGNPLTLKELRGS